ncbi:diaminopimelate epimerase [Streptococcus iniae]|uniref:thioesterase family protein n=1 Tax=Streptococcus iniae TaxID=1346 RepID=UPI0008DA9769|nr:thioesterase family protein [Streptococcus iniae]OHX27390.1 diaminopimelate epimerase [Streptococcus iniae]RLV28170.1 diaminopimelate epimerase [Streptococcus iniae]
MQQYSQLFDTESKHSAKEMGSGELQVLASPALICFMENTAYHFAQETINEDCATTVGVEMSLEHCKASKIGEKVTVIITEFKEEGRKYDFLLEAYVNHELIGKASHRRVKVVKERFMNNL